MNVYEPKIWVVEWHGNSGGEWMALEADTSLKRAQSMMRNWRAKAKEQRGRDKFRIVKYVRNTEGN